MKERIEEKVENNPGISFSELKRDFGVANGQLQYHIQNAEVKRIGKKYVAPEACEDCILNDCCVNKCILGLLRDEKKRKIVENISDTDRKSELANSLGIDSSTLSYHLNILRENNILSGDSLRPEIRELEEF